MSQLLRAGSAVSVGTHCTSKLAEPEPKASSPRARKAGECLRRWAATCFHENSVCAHELLCVWTELMKVHCPTHTFRHDYGFYSSCCWYKSFMFFGFCLFFKVGAEKKGGEGPAELSAALTCTGQEEKDAPAKGERMSSQRGCRKPGTVVPQKAGKISEAGEGMNSRDRRCRRHAAAPEEGRKALQH